MPKQLGLPTDEQLEPFLQFVYEQTTSLSDHMKIADVKKAPAYPENGTYAHFQLCELWRAWQEDFEQDVQARAFWGKEEK